MIINKNRVDMMAFTRQALQWAAAADVSICLDSHQFADKYSKFDSLIAVGVRHELTSESGSAFEKLSAFRAEHKDWVLGYLSYDLKNEVEELTSDKPNPLDFADMYFFVPEHLILFSENEIEIISDEAEKIIEVIYQQQIAAPAAQQSIDIRLAFNKAAYIDAVSIIQHHIVQGDIYEATLCQEFYALNTLIDPLSVYNKLAQSSPAPFGAFVKVKQNYIISASPERFLAKRGNRLISQPIKGTAPRSTNATEDERLKRSLKNNSKEQQENVMIVDLVRNDLTRSAKPGTVQVEELFGIYSFEQVHQMISTVVCEIAETISDVEAIKNTFPMGSMTGAPKLNAMKLIEKHERSRRGVYSGAIGYFDPSGDFDFNVIIRTLLYNAGNQYLSFQAGSAITFYADAEKEYKECLLKVKATMQALGCKDF